MGVYVIYKYTIKHKKNGQNKSDRKIRKSNQDLLPPKITVKPE